MAFLQFLMNGKQLIKVILGYSHTLLECLNLRSLKVRYLQDNSQKSKREKLNKKIKKQRKNKQKSKKTLPKNKD